MIAFEKQVWNTGLEIDYAFNLLETKSLSIFLLMFEQTSTAKIEYLFHFIVVENIPIPKYTIELLSKMPIIVHVNV
jgi:hypothetical protein